MFDGDSSKNPYACARNTENSSGIAYSGSKGPLTTTREPVSLNGLCAVPGGTTRNREALSPHVTFDPAIPEALRTLLFDAQTSGGLLIAVAPDRVESLMAALRREATPAAVRIGRIVTGVPGAIAVG